MSNDQKGKASQVQSQHECLEKASHRLIDAVDELQTRLTAVLVFTPPPPGDKTPPSEQQELVPMADYLRNRCQVLTSLDHKLRDITSRIEL